MRACVCVVRLLSLVQRAQSQSQVFSQRLGLTLAAALHRAQLLTHLTVALAHAALLLTCTHTRDTRVTHRQTKETRTLHTGNRKKKKFDVRNMLHMDTNTLHADLHTRKTLHTDTNTSYTLTHKKCVTCGHKHVIHRCILARETRYTQTQTPVTQ